MTSAQMLQLDCYALLMGGVYLLGWATKDAIIHRVTFLSLIGWALANISVDLFGFGGAPFINPTINAVLAVTIGLIGHRNRSMLCFVLVLLYLAEETVTLGAFSMHAQGERLCYLLLNCIFILRMLAIGGWSVAWLVASRSAPQHRGLSRGLLGS